MNAKQRLDDAMFKVEARATELLRYAHDFDLLGEPWKARDLLNKARQYADAMRRLARVSRQR